MKVILAGYTKTGTKTMNSALTELGYDVYDYVEHFWEHGKEWNKILRKGAEVSNFKRMYENVDAIVDAPVFRFWEEIHWAFPDAKIILTERENEDTWYKSFCGQIKEIFTGRYFQLIMTITPTGRRYFTHWKHLLPSVFGAEAHSIWIHIVMNEMLLKQRYRQHNAYVKQNAPKNKLLVYNVKEGWEPLCEFLGKAVPDKPFPHKNKGGRANEDLLKEHPVMQRMKREFYLCSSILLGLGLFSGWKLSKYFSNKGTKAVLQYSLSIFQAKLRLFTSI